MSSGHKLSEWQRAELKQRWIDGASIEGLARHYRLSPSTVHGHIKNVRHLREVPVYQRLTTILEDRPVEDLPHVNKQFLIALHHEALRSVRANRKAAE